MRRAGPSPGEGPPGQAARYPPRPAPERSDCSNGPREHAGCRSRPMPPIRTPAERRGLRALLRPGPHGPRNPPLRPTPRFLGDTGLGMRRSAHFPAAPGWGRGRHSAEQARGRYREPLPGHTARIPTTMDREVPGHPSPLVAAPRRSRPAPHGTARGSGAREGAASGTRRRPAPPASYVSSDRQESSRRGRLRRSLGRSSTPSSRRSCTRGRQWPGIAALKAATCEADIPRLVFRAAPQRRYHPI